MYIKKSDVKNAISLLEWQIKKDNKRKIDFFKETIDTLPTYNPYDEIIKVIDEMTIGSHQTYAGLGYLDAFKELKDKLLTK